MQITTTRVDDGWKGSLGAVDAAALIAVFRADLVDKTRYTIAQVAEPKQLRATVALRTCLEGSGPLMVGTPDIYVAVVAGGLVAMRGTQNISLEDAAAACVACVGNTREPVTYVAIAGEFVRVRVRVERSYDRETRKVTERPVYTPEALLPASEVMKPYYGSSGGSVRLAAFSVDNVAFARKDHCPAYLAAVVARVYSLVDWEFTRAYRFSNALLIESSQAEIWRIREAVARVSAAQIPFHSGPHRHVATVSAATLETYEESGPSVDEWLDILAQDLATQQARGGDGVESSYWGWPDRRAPRAPN